jgi:YD repeat-containing protein
MRAVLAVAMVACGGDKTTDGAPLVDTTTPPDTETTTSTDSGTDSGTTSTAHDWACFDEMAYDADADGVVDGAGYDGYDEANPTWLMYTEVDGELNGILDYVDTYVRDAQGNVLHFERERTGALTYDQTFDERGNLLTYAEDDGSDGTVDYAFTYTWDANDQPLHEEYDTNGDGDPDYVADFVRDADGNRLSATEDQDGDGVIDEWYAYTRDDVGREVLVTGDLGNDGVIDYRRTLTYTDPVLRVGTSDADDGDDGTIEEHDAFAYDVDGDQLYSAVEYDPVDGVWDDERTYTYDAEGNRTSLDWTTLLYGEPFHLDYTWGYDGLGRLISEERLWVYADSGDVIEHYVFTFTFGGTCPS